MQFIISHTQSTYAADVTTCDSAYDRQVETTAHMYDCVLDPCTFITALPLVD